MNTELTASVQQLLDERVASGDEVGLKVAVYVDGVLAVDVWAGSADEITGRPVDGGTLFTSWSMTKGLVATCLHLLVDRGQAEYDAPIATYWPEFAAHGKGSATLRHALIHAAGVPQMPDGVTPEMMTDWEAMCAAIAGHAPLWTPGSTIAYHAWTFGWIIGEIVRRIDGRPLAQFAREELCQPLGIETFYLGIPDAAEPRVARLRQHSSSLEATLQFSDMARRAMPPHVTTAEVVNRPDVRRASIPGGGGIMNARAVARHYAMLAGSGALDGMRLLSPERIGTISALQTDAVDQVVGVPLRKALGYQLADDPRATGFGHGGNGGSLGFADPARNLAFGLTKTLMRNDVPGQGIADVVAGAVVRHVDAARRA
jgi:CubicO group peptidase (beta-lactamase class C family)